MKTPAIEFIRYTFEAAPDKAPNPFPVSLEMYKEIRAYIEGEEFTTYTGEPSDILSTIEGLEHVKLEIK